MFLLTLHKQVNPCDLRHQLVTSRPLLEHGQEQARLKELLKVGMGRGLCGNCPRKPTERNFTLFFLVSKVSGI